MSRRCRFFTPVLVSASLLMLQKPDAYAQDLKAYCANVGDDDRVKKIPSQFVAAARRIFNFGAEDTDKDIQESTVSRCMSGSAWLCNFGANRICQKADTDRTSKGADNYCREFPGSEVVPMVATGHATIHSWRCVGKKARIVDSKKVDPRGFIADQWEPLSE